MELAQKQTKGKGQVFPRCSAKGLGKPSAFPLQGEGLGPRSHGEFGRQCFQLTSAPLFPPGHRMVPPLVILFLS